MISWWDSRWLFLISCLVKPPNSMGHCSLASSINSPAWPFPEEWTWYLVELLTPSKAKRHTKWSVLHQQYWQIMQHTCSHYCEPPLAIIKHTPRCPKHLTIRMHSPEYPSILHPILYPGTCSLTPSNSASASHCGDKPLIQHNHWECVYPHVSTTGSNIIGCYPTMII